MDKSYKDYCQEALKKDPKTYSSVFMKDGSIKPPPRMTGCGSKVKFPKQIPRKDLLSMRKDGWKPRPKYKKQPELKITGTEVKIRGRKINLTILKMPDNPSPQEYNRIWMSNYRVRQRIKKLKEKYGITRIL